MSSDNIKKLPIFIKNLSKYFDGIQALKNVSLEMKEGEILGLLGPNGAGKTTLISILSSLEKSTSGKAYIFGHDVESQNLKEWIGVKNLFGLVPQEIVNHGFFTTIEVLRFISGYHGYRNNEDYIQYLLKKLALDEHKNKKVHALSGGMRRRFMIAKALVHRPKLLILDEPTAGVDIELRSNLWSFVRELNKTGTSILLTTHYLEEAENLCDRVAIINKGEIKKVAPTQELVKTLTQRKFKISLKSSLPKCESPFLIQQTDKELMFNLPSRMEIGDLLTTLQLDMSFVTDFKIEEGTLEDAFLQIVVEGSK